MQGVHNCIKNHRLVVSKYEIFQDVNSKATIVTNCMYGICFAQVNKRRICCAVYMHGTQNNRKSALGCIQAWLMLRCLQAERQMLCFKHHIITIIIIIIIISVYYIYIY